MFKNNLQTRIQSLFYNNKCVMNKIRLRMVHNHTWTLPEGFDTGIKVYNPILKQKTPLIVRNEHFVSWYMCGPTVYDSSHLGHGCCYVQFDILRRILEKFYNLRTVIALGMTDIDDKIIAKSNSTGTDCSVITKSYELEFFNDMNNLNVQPPSYVVRVTEHIPQIVKFIETLVQKNYAYRTEDGSVYFDTTTVSNYGKLSKVETSQESHEIKKSTADFALWKSSKLNEPSWDSPWGPGRPGWHIECSVMASRLFGNNLDIHSGGIDLKFPHHENEETQSCAFHQVKQWVNYWLHSGHLFIKGEKMAKSLKNYITINDFLEKYSGDQFRMFCLLSRYSKDVEYDENMMRSACINYDKVSTFLRDTDSYIKGQVKQLQLDESDLLQHLISTKTKIKESLNDDFNTPLCVDLINQLITHVNKILFTNTNNEQADLLSVSSPIVSIVRDYVQEFYISLGFVLQSHNKANIENVQKLETIVNHTVKFRNEIRQTAFNSCSDKTIKSLLLRSCDDVRDRLETVNVKIKDVSKSESRWSINK